MSAAARAEARRKAILSRGSDRLAKLTTSARGEDAPAYIHDDPPLPSLNAASTFLGDSTNDMPSPARLTPSPSPSPQPPSSRSTPASGRPSNIFEAMAAGGGMDNSPWGPEQQQQFMQALLNASGGMPMPQMPQLGSTDATAGKEGIPPPENPFAALMAASAGMGGAGPDGAGGAGMFPPFGPPGMAGMGAFPGASMEPPKPKSRLQKALPLLHLISMWCLLAYFVLWAEPSQYRALVGEDTTAYGFWRRWSSLGRGSPALVDTLERFRVQLVPFFWAFTTLQIALHSLRIVSGFDTVQPPTLLAMVLPSLPPPIPSVITNGLKYMQMGSLFLDDIAGLIVGLGFIVYFSGWFAQSV